MKKLLTCGVRRALIFGLLCLITGLSKAAPINLIISALPPFMNQSNNQMEGITVDLAKELFRRAGVQYHFLFMPPKRALITAMNTSNYCVLAVERSQERETLFQWISPILISRHALYSRKEENYQIDTLEEARSYKIGSYLGSGVGEYLESQGFQVEYSSQNELNVRKLLTKRIDLWASDTISATMLSSQYQTGILEPEIIFLTTLRGMACNNDMDGNTIALLQQTLMDMYRDGTVQNHYQSYLPEGRSWLAN